MSPYLQIGCPRCTDFRPTSTSRSRPAAIPGDQSVSHRALILGALAVGETRVLGP